nr:hypothetical protein 38 [Burkholderiaceae bacterium]
MGFAYFMENRTAQMQTPTVFRPPVLEGRAFFIWSLLYEEKNKRKEYSKNSEGKETMDITC